MIYDLLIYLGLWWQLRHLRQHFLSMSKDSWDTHLSFLLNFLISVSEVTAVDHNFRQGHFSEKQQCSMFPKKFHKNFGNIYWISKACLRLYASKFMCDIRILVEHLLLLSVDKNVHVKTIQKNVLKSDIKMTTYWDLFVPKA